MTISAKRLLDAPIIYPNMDNRMGGNINGPSIIRVPDWVKNPLGRYYLYFADHKGKYIRMAYANTVLGPWTTYVPGVLDVEQSLFVPIDPPEPPLSECPDWAIGLEGGYLYAHIASPDVHVDNPNTRIRMYYHGLLANGDQQTRIAYSDNGLMFTPRPALLGPPYFRTFSYGTWVYAISWAGVVLRSRSWDGPFEMGHKLLDLKTSNQPKRSIRHAEVYIRENVLHILFSCIDDCPERILRTQIVLSSDWQNWTATEPVLVLEPELDWEGIDAPLTRSKIGASHFRQRSLLDPCVFEDEGKIYLLYCGAAESGGIGVAELYF